MKMKKIFACFLFLSLLIVPKAQNISDSIHIAHYELNLDMTDFTHRIINGYADLRVVTKANALSTYVFDLQGLSVDSVWVNNTNTSFLQTPMKVRVNYTSAIGDTAVVRIYYHGTPISDVRWGGFYYSGPYCYNMGVAFDAQPHNFGRCWYPCLDVFTDKSTYTMQIRTEAGKMAVCGGMLTDSLTLSDGSRVWKWQLDEPIPTYLASVAVGPYMLFSDTFQGIQGDVPIQIYAQPNTISNVAGSFERLKEILHAFESSFGPYRWPKVGYVAVNFSSGAMEHATNIAYPNAAIDGTHAYETLLGHELFHHWFGDLVTCSRAEEMWINEGFASYAEALMQEALYGDSAYLDYMRDVHRTTLLNLAKDDGGYYALDTVPQEITYGTHSYQKGSIVVHSLRNYMGDSLFFSSFRSMLDEYAYKNISSEEMFTYLSQVSGTNIMDFYDGWVHQPGFLHFSIDSIVLLQGSNYRVYLHQKLHAATRFANNNRVDLTFVSNDMDFYTVPNALFSGEFGCVDVTLPFEPKFGIVDYYEKLADATIDYTISMVSGMSFNCENAYCTVKVEDFSDTLWVRVEHNMVSPDQPEQLPDGIYRMSDNHYWNINIADRSDALTLPVGSLFFRFQSGLATSPDYALLQNYNANNIKLLYRATTAEPWRIVETTRTGSPVSGSLKTNFLASGQYCLAVGEPTASMEEHSVKVSLLIYPNPANDRLNICLDGTNGRVQATLYDSMGRVVKVVKIKRGKTIVDVNDLEAGCYLLSVKDAKGNTTVRRWMKQ